MLPEPIEPPARAQGGTVSRRRWFCDRDGIMVRADENGRIIGSVQRSTEPYRPERGSAAAGPAFAPIWLAYYGNFILGFYVRMAQARRAVDEAIDAAAADPSGMHYRVRG